MSPNQSFDKLGATYFEIWQNDRFKNYHAFIYETQYFQKNWGFRQNLDLRDIWASKRVVWNVFFSWQAWYVRIFIIYDLKSLLSGIYVEKQ